MNAPSTLYSAHNPEIAFANVCKREGLQDSSFKIQYSRFKRVLESWIPNSGS